MSYFPMLLLSWQSSEQPFTLLKETRKKDSSSTLPTLKLFSFKIVKKLANAKDAPNGLTIFTSIRVEKNSTDEVIVGQKRVVVKNKVETNKVVQHMYFEISVNIDIFLGVTLILLSFSLSAIKF